MAQEESALDNIGNSSEVLGFGLKYLANAPDSQITLTPYDVAKLLDDVMEVLRGVSYPSLGIFKHVTYGLIKAYLRGRKIRVDRKNCTTVFATLVTKGFHRRSPGNGWYQTWCKRVLEGREENQLTPGDWLTYGQATWSAGAPRPSYPIGHIGDIIVPDTPTKPLIFSTNSKKIVFRDFNELEEFVVSLWDTVHHIERTHYNLEKLTVPPSYAYRAIMEWDELIKKNLSRSGQLIDQNESEDP